MSNYEVHHRGERQVIQADRVKISNLPPLTFYRGGKPVAQFLSWDSWRLIDKPEMPAAKPRSTRKTSR